MKIRINDEKFSIKTLSQLTVKEYIELVKNDEVSALHLIANQINIPEDILLKSKIRADKHLDKCIMDCQIQIDHIENVNKKKYLTVAGESFDIEKIGGGEHGYTYIFDLFLAHILPKVEANEITEPIYTMLGCLATNLLTDCFDLGVMKRYFDSLMEEKWIDVLPIAFFLQKRYLKRGHFGSK